MINLFFTRIKKSFLLLIALTFIAVFTLNAVLVNTSTNTAKKDTLIADNLNLIFTKQQQHDVPLTFQLPNVNLKTAFLELKVHDADSKTEGELWVNDVKVTNLFPHRSGNNNAKWSTQYVEFPPELLKNGQNIFTFKHIKTGGFKIDRLRVVMIDNTHNIKAFPGAEGFGTDTTGGRGGRVIAVTSLEDSGPGSLREAIEASGPRMIVFHVGGTIFLKKPINIRNPYMTIAGQTAPGDGVQIAHAPLNVKTHDVVIRGMRIRPGDIHKKSYDAIDLHGGDAPIRNVVIDHCSLSWGIDENIGFWNDVKDITISWSIISEGLYDSYHYKKVPHSRGILVGSDVKNISIHHNLFAHNNRRNPELAGGSTTEVINNIIYNWGAHAILPQNAGESEPLYANIVGNRAIAGNNIEERERSQHIINIYKEFNSQSRLYVDDNQDPKPMPNQQSQADVIHVESGADVSQYLVDSPIAVAWSGDVTIHPQRKLKPLILDHVGAFAPQQDAVDTRIVSDVRQKTGKIIDSQSEVGGWPELRETVKQDSDGDGLPNDWEKAHGYLDQNNPNDALEDYNNDGYLNIEDYINSFFKEPA